MGRYLGALLKVPAIQNKQVQISVMTSFFAFVSVFELGLTPNRLLQCPAENVVLERLRSKLSIPSTRIDEKERSSYQGYVGLLKLLGEGKGKHWGLESIKITLTHFLLKFMTPQDYQDFEDSLISGF